MQHRDVTRDHGAHVRAQHLDDHLAAIGQHCGMHLRDRSGGKRLGLEAAEHLFQRLVERGLHQCARALARERRHAVLQLHQLVSDVRWQQVAARGDGLAELHEHRTQFLERQAQPLGAIAAAAALEPQPGAEQVDQAESLVKVGALHVVEQLVAFDHAVDLDQAAGDGQVHRSSSRCPRGASSAATRASSRSACSRRRSTPSRNSPASARVTSSRRSCVKYSPTLRATVRELSLA